MREFGLKQLGVAICIVGSVLALLYIPATAYGINQGWHFVFECVEKCEPVTQNKNISESGSGRTVAFDNPAKKSAYQFINVETLIVELVLINGAGLGLFFYARKQDVVPSGLGNAPVSGTFSFNPIPPQDEANMSVGAQNLAQPPQASNEQSQIFCSSCGRKNNTGQKFCIHCGSSLS